MKNEISNSGDWHQKANCLGASFELFFPDSNDQVAINAAKAICAKCTVKEECLEEALSLPIGRQFGIAGGLTAPERKALIKKQRSS